MGGTIQNPITSKNPRRAKRTVTSSLRPRKRSRTYLSLDQKEQSLTTTNLSSLERSDLTLTHWPCQSCTCPQGAFCYPVDKCIRCGHTMDDHEDVHHRWNPDCDFVCERSNLVHSILQLVRNTRVVVIRATPQVGKTTLLRLLGRHILYKEQELEPVFIEWKHRGMRDGLPYKQYLEQKRSRWQEDNAKYRPHNPKATTVYLIDEAQDSYEEEQLWTRTLKSYNTRQQSMFVLVCIYGGAGVTTRHEPNIESQALLVDRLQRVELRQSIFGCPYMLFKPQETAETVQKWAIVNKLQLKAGVSEVRVAYRRLFPGPEPGTDLQRTSLQQICLNAIERFSPSVLQRRNSQGIPETAFQDELYCCLNYELQSLPILSEYSHTKDGRIDFYVFDKKWGIEVLQSRSKADITEHIRQFQTGGKYQEWNILDDYIILNFCSKSVLQEIEIEDVSIQPRFLQIAIDLEECIAEVYTYNKQLRATLDLGEGRQRYYANDFDLSENSDTTQILQDRVTQAEREKEDMMRRIAELERLVNKDNTGLR
ncbi:hypothetical protein BDY21DRAFT_327253 [Lineolata rhizophorae]|uniref:Uncharacterized protein n=1 Tax=Lineolata rhizophorae TaxID=578093 RepID=A0A6A6NQ30_9PEZI|nr:hypothetical protein BDY21DRAFT_327253 [Lineolata rhizophorae]